MKKRALVRGGRNFRVECYGYACDEAFTKNSACLVILVIQELIATDDQQRVHAHTLKEVAQLASNVTAADDGYRLRHFANFEHVVAGPIWHVKRRAPRSATCGQDEVVGRDGITIYPEGSVSSKCGLAAIESNAGPKRVFQDAIVLFREVEGVTENRVGIGCAHRCLEPKPLCLPRAFCGVGVADK